MRERILFDLENKSIGRYALDVVTNVRRVDVAEFKEGAVDVFAREVPSAASSRYF